MSAYVLNINKGTTINHPSLPNGKLPGLVAVKIDESLVPQFKHLIGAIVFERVEEGQ